MKYFNRISTVLASVSLGVCAFALLSAPLLAANIPLLTGVTGTNPATFPADLPDINSTISNINSAGASGINPNTMASFGNFRNYLDNGGMAVAQRGTAAQTGGTTSGCTVNAYAADRWCIDTNVTSGAGKGQVVTATPSPLTGFVNSMTVFRNSGALLQPVCSIQEVPTNDAIQLQAQQATFSVYLQAMAGLSADNGNVVNMFIMTGTGTDQGLGTMTASPAITPAWTGIASSITAAKTITTGWVRYSLTGSIPSTAKEIAVAVCFTPTASGAGATDGFAMVGAQLEQGPVPSSFEFRPLGIETAKAQQYYWQVADPAATVPLPSSCFVTAANTTVKCQVTLPATMRTTPTTTVSNATSFGIVATAGTAGTCTTLAATASSNTVQSIGLTCTTGATIALGSATPLIGAAVASAILQASADF